MTSFFTQHGLPVVIHIGLPRTGTTWMQTQFLPFLKGVKYNPRHLLFTLFWHQKVLHEGRDIGIAPDLGLQLFYQAASYPNGLPVIMSSELLSADFFFQTHVNFADVMKRIVPKAKVLIVLRELDEWLKSLHACAVGNFQFRPLEEFANGKELSCEETREHQMTLAQMWNMFGVRREKIDFDVKVERYKELFDDVMVRDYSELKEDNQKFADSICDWMGVQKVKVEHAIINPSLNVDKVLELNEKRGRQHAFNYVMMFKQKVLPREFFGMPGHNNEKET